MAPAALSTAEQVVIIPVVITPLRSETVLAAAHVCDDAFSQSSYSWSRPLRMKKGGFRAWMEQSYMHDRVRLATAGAEPPSFVALSEGSLVGVCANEDFNAPPATEESDDDPGRAAIDGILKACKTQFWSQAEERKLPLSPSDRGRACYIAFLAVASSARRRSVGKRLVANTEEASLAAGYKVLVAFCTSQNSASLFSCVGFERLGDVISYQAWQLPDGSIPFASLPGDGCHVMFKQLL
jgi:ribosomal protein S18 acetylase RimI-like enzyme